MAGGIFPGYPFQPNWKCVIFTAVLASGYWYLPQKNWWVLVALLILPYVAMSWYDYMYECSNKLKPTIVPFGRQLFLPLKPHGYKQEYSTLPPEAIQAMDRLDHTVAWILMVLTGSFVVSKLL